MTTQPAAQNAFAPPVQTVVLHSAQFRAGREGAWRDLEALIGRVEGKGVASLSAEDMQRLPTLYRTAISSLSVARTIALDRNLILYLEALTLRAYFIVYGPRAGLGETLGAFVRRGFPRIVRAHLGPIAIAFFAVLAGATVGFILAVGDESWLRLLVPSGMAGGRGAASTAEDLRSHEIFAPWPGFVVSFVVFANALFRNNAAVAILTFALGVAGGAPTLVLLFFQGLMIGAFAALHYNRGLLVDFLGWISIHGVTEIGALILCGAGGLAIAAAVLRPGRYARIDNLSREGRQAAGLAGGGILMLFVAGLIEGGFRQLIASTPGRFAFAAATAIAWGLYFAYAGREARRGE